MAALLISLSCLDDEEAEEDASRFRWLLMLFCRLLDEVEALREDEVFGEEDNLARFTNDVGIAG